MKSIASEKVVMVRIARDDVAPSIIEFFDTREEVDRVIEDLAPLVEHIVSWPAQATVVR